MIFLRILELYFLTLVPDQTVHFIHRQLYIILTLISVFVIPAKFRTAELWVRCLALEVMTLGAFNCGLIFVMTSYNFRSTWRSLIPGNDLLFIGWISRWFEDAAFVKHSNNVLRVNIDATLIYTATSWRYFLLKQVILGEVFICSNILFLHIN